VHDDVVAGTRLRLFEEQRPRLTGICYRILGSVADAEDVVQEAWLRWTNVDPDGIDSTQAYLTTIATRLALDRLRRAKAQREVYTGSWLPEPVVADPGDQAGDPAAVAELADSLSMALLVVLETLSPLERAAFVLREVFRRPYPEVAAALGRSESAVRQLVHRAQGRVEAGHVRYAADRATHARLVRRFLAACESADVGELMEILAPDVMIISDGGGVAQAPRLPVHGRDNVARLLAGFSRRVPPGTVFCLELFNGTLGIVARTATGDPISAMALTTIGDQVQSMHLVANPAKLWPLASGREVDLL
jgi:RNA polymerase sigma-70 factor (ECF subfamily)